MTVGSVNLNKDFERYRQSFLAHLVRDGLSSEGMKVGVLLMNEELDFWKFKPALQWQIGEQIGMKQPSVSKAVRELVEKGFLIEGVPLGRCKTYRMKRKKFILRAA
jgi:DNA-binding MarR family transcriptional regulator